MKKLSFLVPVLNIVTRVLLGLVLVTALVLNLGMAYIMFAPDSLPKPFYLMYSATGGVQPVLAEGQTPTGEETPVVEATPTEEVVEIHPGSGVMLNTGTKIINLADTSQKRYIRVTIVVEFAPDNPEYTALPEEEKLTYMAEFNEELNGILPLVDDSIITLLSTKTFEELYTADGKELVREELMTRVGEKLHEFHIIAVYFTEFVVE